MNRHFKKYVYYFLGRFFDLFGNYEKASNYYAKVIRYRTFFWDVQEKFTHSFQKRLVKPCLEIHGGIGDFLQCLPFVLENKNFKYIVVTHFPNAKFFFDELGVKISNFYFYNNLSQYKKIKNFIGSSFLSFQAPRSIFFERPVFVKSPKLFKFNNRTIGVHPGSSKIGGNKRLPIPFVVDLCKKLNQENFNVILFGTEDELRKIPIKNNSALVFYINKSLIKNFSQVLNCDGFIGSDSVFKSVSSMHKIPTLVLTVDEKNNFRDRVFLNPYMSESVLTVFKYKNLKKENQENALTFCQNWIRNLP